MMALRAAILVLPIAACGPATTGLLTPVVDMKGVDQTAYNRDVTWCLENRPFVMHNDYLVKCIQAKGYKVLNQY